MLITWGVWIGIAIAALAARFMAMNPKLVGSPETTNIAPGRQREICAELGPCSRLP